MQICNCGAAAGYPHKAECPWPDYHTEASESWKFYFSIGGIPICPVCKEHVQLSWYDNVYYHAPTNIIYEHEESCAAREGHRTVYTPCECNVVWKHLHCWVRESQQS